jgi:hypothetical protein
MSEAEAVCEVCGGRIVAMGEYGPVCENGHDGIPPETARRLDLETGAAESPTLRAKIIEALFLGEGVEDKADRIMAVFANEPLDRLAAFLRGVGYKVELDERPAPNWLLVERDGG